MPKSLEMALAVYGIMKAGAAYVPLDPFAPAARLAFVMRDCGIHHLVTDGGRREVLQAVLAEEAELSCLIGPSPETSLPVTTISWADVDHAPEFSTAAAFGVEQDLAYILYTSGSTGTPKGIMHTHRSALSFAEWAASAYGLQSGDRLSNHAPLHFDLSTFDLFASHLAGAVTVLIPEGITKFPASMAGLIESEKLTVWYSVPFALIQMLLHARLPSRDLNSLRWVLFAGEPFPTKHLRALMAQLPRARFSNLFGPTETNVCTFYHVPPLSEDSDEPIPIGYPCANVEALVVDGDGRQVATGEVGELLIRGGVVMSGYWGQPERTQKGFFRRPVVPGLEDVFYRTGDLVQQGPDGLLRYLGRKDRQIKTRGYRVELDEIEVALLSHGGVQEAAAYAVPDGEGSSLIEAAVIARPGTDLTSTQLIEHLSGRLPPFAIPVRLDVHDDLPRTSTGKIDRRTLQDRSTERLAQMARQVGNP
jgi:amino acid adenylation domain-containing protein